MEVEVRRRDTGTSSRWTGGCRRVGPGSIVSGVAERRPPRSPPSQSPSSWLSQSVLCCAVLACCLLAQRCPQGLLLLLLPPLNHRPLMPCCSITCRTLVAHTHTHSSRGGHRCRVISGQPRSSLVGSSVVFPPPLSLSLSLCLSLSSLFSLSQSVHSLHSSVLLHHHGTALSH